jgi:hypothetical protein
MRRVSNMKNQMVQTIVELQKRGVAIYLTDAGYKVFLKLMSESVDEVATAEEKVG